MAAAFGTPYHQKVVRFRSPSGGRKSPGAPCVISPPRVIRRMAQSDQACTSPVSPAGGDRSPGAPCVISPPRVIRTMAQSDQACTSPVISSRSLPTATHLPFSKVPLISAPGASPPRVVSPSGNCVQGSRLGSTPATSQQRAHVFSFGSPGSISRRVSCQGSSVSMKVSGQGSPGALSRKASCQDDVLSKTMGTQRIARVIKQWKGYRCTVDHLSATKQATINLRQGEQQVSKGVTSQVQRPVATNIIQKATPKAQAVSALPVAAVAPRDALHIKRAEPEMLSDLTPVTCLPTASVQLNHLEPHVKQVCEKITYSLGNRQNLKELVVRIFKEAADNVQHVHTPNSMRTFASLFGGSLTPATPKAADESEMATPEPRRVEDIHLDMEGLSVFANLMSAQMSLPPYAFGNLEDAFIMFDFDGDGVLNVYEIYKFVKFHLKEYRLQLAGAEEIEIPWQTPAEAGYHIVQDLGHGNHGIAKLAKKADGEEVAIKVIDKKTASESRVKETMEEYNAMNMLSCELIAGVQTMFQDQEFYYMVCHLYRGGDLLVLRQNAEEHNVTMTVDWWRQIFRQCLEALAFMHGQAIMHCDIKEANIMLKIANYQEPQIVVIDLGVCRSVTRTDDETPSGTPGYVPPETLRDFRWYPRGDIFSLGVTFFQLLCGMTPPDSGAFMEGCRSAEEIFKTTLEKEPPWDRFPDYMDDFKSIVMLMLEKERLKRPKAPQVLVEDWFTGDIAEKNLVPEISDARDSRKLHNKVKPQHEFATEGITRSLTNRIDQCEFFQELQGLAPE